MERLSHYSDDPVSVVHSMAQESGRRFEYAKPQGLWVSVDGPRSWEEWCKSEAPSYLGKRRYEVKLEPRAEILYLRTPSAIDEFTDMYARKFAYPTGYQVRCIDWHKVAAEYQGIIITPYIWERRLHHGTSWYYGWDCASGCIWDAAAIARIEFMSAVEGSSTFSIEEIQSG